MKKISIVVLLLTIFFSPVFSGAKSNADKNSNDFQHNWSWKRLDPKLQAAWLEAKNSGNMSKNLECFVRTQPPFNYGNRDFLVGAGFVVRLQAGTTFSGHVSAADLPNIAKLGFVEKIFLAEKKPKKKNKHYNR